MRRPKETDVRIFFQPCYFGGVFDASWNWNVNQIVLQTSFTNKTWQLLGGVSLPALPWVEDWDDRLLWTSLVLFTSLWWATQPTPGVPWYVCKFCFLLTWTDSAEMERSKVIRKQCTVSSCMSRGGAIVLWCSQLEMIFFEDLSIFLLPMARLDVFIFNRGSLLTQLRCCQLIFIPSQSGCTPQAFQYMPTPFVHLLISSTSRLLWVW